MIYDKVTNFKTYKLGKAWEQAFEFIASLTPESEEKVYDLPQGMFAIVSNNKTKASSDALLESHRKYIDIQVAITGAEIIECFATDDLEVTEEYDGEKDAGFFRYPGNPMSRVRNYPGFFSALWPQDAHMPLLQVGDVTEVKKVVVKIPVDLI